MADKSTREKWDEIVRTLFDGDYDRAYSAFPQDEESRCESIPTGSSRWQAMNGSVSEWVKSDPPGNGCRCHELAPANAAAEGR